MPQHRGVIQSYGKLEDTKGVNRNPKYNDQKKKDIKTIIYKTLHRKFKMNPTKNGSEPRYSGVYAVPVPQMAPVMLQLNNMTIMLCRNRVGQGRT